MGGGWFRRLSGGQGGHGEDQSGKCRKTHEDFLVRKAIGCRYGRRKKRCSCPVEFYSMDAGAGKKEWDPSFEGSHCQQFVLRRLSSWPRPGARPAPPGQRL